MEAGGDSAGSYLCRSHRLVVEDGSEKMSSGGISTVAVGDEKLANCLPKAGSKDVSDDSMMEDEDHPNLEEYWKTNMEDSMSDDQDDDDITMDVDKAMDETKLAHAAAPPSPVSTSTTASTSTVGTSANSNSHGGGRTSIFGELATFLQAMQQQQPPPPQEQHLLSSAHAIDREDRQSPISLTDSSYSSSSSSSMQHDDEHHFDSLCERLRTNDPYTSQVVVDESFPPGYANALGQAILGTETGTRRNGLVTTLGLELDTLLPPPPMDGIVPQGPMAIMAAMAGAAAAAAGVGQAPVVAAARSIPDELVPLLSYLRSVKAAVLRELGLYTRFTTPVDTDVVQSILQAALEGVAAKVAVNDAAPSVLRIGRGIAIPLPVLCRILLQSSSPWHDANDDLGRLGRFLAHFTQSSSTLSPMNEDVAQSCALATNHDGVHCLTMYPKSVAFIVHTILVHLPSHPCLNELVFPLHPGGRCLHSSIRHVELAGYDFDGPVMERVFTGLLANYGRVQPRNEASEETQQLHKLSFTNCTFDADATIQFEQFWSTAAPNEAADTAPFLFELGISGRLATMAGRRHPSMFYGADGSSISAGEMAARLLLPPLQISNMASTQTIGSTLPKLSLDIDNIVDFVRPYAQHAARIRLAHLELGDISADDWETLRTYLPQVVHLKELTINLHFRSIVVSDLMAMTRCNGSLQQLHIPADKLSVLTAKEGRLVQAFLQRNRDVPRLLVQPCGAEVDEGPIKAQAERNAGTSSGMYPALLRSKKPAKQMVPNTAFLGLLALGDVAGCAEASLASSDKDNDDME